MCSANQLAQANGSVEGQGLALTIWLQLVHNFHLVLKVEMVCADRDRLHFLCRRLVGLIGIFKNFIYLW